VSYKSETGGLEQSAAVKKEYPKTPDEQDLPYLQPGDRAVLAPVHAVVTVKKKLLCK